MKNQKKHDNEKEKNMNQRVLTSYYNNKVWVSVVSKHQSESKSYIILKNNVFLKIVYSYADAVYHSVAVLEKMSLKINTFTFMLRLDSDTV